MLIVSLSIFWKYIYLAAHISTHLFLHFSYIISYTLTTPLHITHHNSSKLHSLTLKFCCFAAHKYISILFYTNLTAPISKYQNTSSYLSLTKYFLLESNLYNFSSSYNLIFFTIFNLHFSHTSIYHTYFKYYCCEILKYSQMYEPYRSIVWQERGQTHKDLYERRKIN